MNTLHAYPAKCRFYSTGRWEVWSRFRSTSTMTRNFENASRVKGTHSYPQNLEVNSNSFTEFPSNRFSDTNRVKVIHSKMNAIQKSPNKIVIQENLPERYTYSNCINKFDICGKTRSRKVLEKRLETCTSGFLLFPVPSEKTLTEVLIINMFRDFLKLGVRYSQSSNFWKTPKRMNEAVKINSKPYLEANYLQAMKPDPTLKTQEIGKTPKDMMQG